MITLQNWKSKEPVFALPKAIPSSICSNLIFDWRPFRRRIANCFWDYFLPLHWYCYLLKLFSYPDDSRKQDSRMQFMYEVHAWGVLWSRAKSEWRRVSPVETTGVSMGSELGERPPWPFAVKTWARPRFRFLRGRVKSICNTEGQLSRSVRGRKRVTRSK